eukprot:1175521-Prorocentrum_minimum.AAC.3
MTPTLSPLFYYSHSSTQFPNRERKPFIPTLLLQSFINTIPESIFYYSHSSTQFPNQSFITVIHQHNSRIESASRPSVRQKRPETAQTRHPPRSRKRRPEPRPARARPLTFGHLGGPAECTRRGHHYRGDDPREGRDGADEAGEDAKCGGKLESTGGGGGGGGLLGLGLGPPVGGGLQRPLCGDGSQAPRRGHGEAGAGGKCEADAGGGEGLGVGQGGGGCSMNGMLVVQRLMPPAVRAASTGHIDS